ncbi:MAG TPA: helix-turn-helix domain-containing protein [Rhizomicrobium sp.]
MRGQRVAGVRERVIEEPEASAVREQIGMSQREFINLVGVPVKTLQNWEQGGTRPTGSARALLRAIAKDPKNVLRALAA